MTTEQEWQQVERESNEIKREFIEALTKIVKENRLDCIKANGFEIYCSRHDYASPQQAAAPAAERKPDPLNLTKEEEDLLGLKPL